ncbi:MAG: DnaA regulatory inactivator Hda [Candidatus Accumulibacter sp.]|jgi:DnaA family protein|nr:DnaA regulatory inactivator Hda [Accumulibacter sp.]
MRQLLLDLLPENPPRFDDFIAGENSEALTGLAAWLSPESRETSLFLWGESGSGKTHLLRASGAYYHDAAADSAPVFPDNAALFYAVDNVGALDEAGQIALFNLFNFLGASGGRLLAASDRPPRELPFREDARTRLASGLIYRLTPLGDEEKREALVSWALGRGLRLSGEAVDYLLARAPRDMGTLSFLLTALERRSLERKRTITLALLREILYAPTLE